MSSKNSGLRVLPIYWLRAGLFLWVFIVSFLFSLEDLQAKTPHQCEYYRVVKVVDGDTFKIYFKGEERKVRMVGIDAPETVHPDKEVQFFGIEASRKLKTLIEGRRVCLQRDPYQSEDKYRRLLRYVWMNDTMINRLLVEEGYARVYKRFKFRYLEEFLRVESKARAKKIGIWNDEARKRWEKRRLRNETFARESCGTGGTVCAGKHLLKRFKGECKTVRFFVRKAYDSGEAVFLNSRIDYQDPDNFTVVIFDNYRYKFTEEPVYFFLLETVDVSGIIKEYEGRAEIILRHPLQIRILSNKTKEQRRMSRLLKAMKGAETCGTGSTICPEDADKYIGKDTTVRFFVIDTRANTLGDSFLYSRLYPLQEKGFYVMIRRDYISAFPSPPHIYYWWKSIDVSGTIEEFKGVTEILVKSPSQIKILNTEGGEDAYSFNKGGIPYQSWCKEDRKGLSIH